MRRYKKKEILEMLILMRREQDNIINCWNRSEQLIALLTECQERAIHIGNIIEDCIGENCVTISYLEEYCELLYQMGYLMHDDVNRIAEKLEISISKVEESIHRDIVNDKFEIVFLPYKASMWDSLESVWIEANDNEDCNAYVIPIPYFEKNTDGTISKMYYESNKFPDYVPITSWEEYDIESRHPDIIFIHNPYDNGNFVTTIHPKFYSKVIKDFCGQLVYIPYFVCTDDVPKHFCVNAGTLYAHKVIVQSEEIRQTYITEYESFLFENNLAKLFELGENKFVALKSPKFEKVTRTKREELDIPNDWNDILIKRNADGKTRKIILYNTTVSELLEYKNKHIDKIKKVVDYFKKNNEVILWWRPHPLIQSTLVAMHPELSDEYNYIVNQYKKEAYGIYDETPDVHRAMAMSDAYYGDQSSLVALYIMTGKPIMIQNVDEN